MTTGKNSHGMIAVDKIGTKVLFLNPATYATEVVIDGFPRTVHELLVMPETGLAYVPIFGDGIHGRNPNPGHLIAVIDLTKRAHVRDIDLRPYIAPHTLRRGPDGLVYITCENSAVGAVIAPPPPGGGPRPLCSNTRPKPARWWGGPPGRAKSRSRSSIPARPTGTGS